jgi:hypothetical protein
MNDTFEMKDAHIKIVDGRVPDAHIGSVHTRAIIDRCRTGCGSELSTMDIEKLSLH